MTFRPKSTNRADMSFRSRAVHDINDTPILKFIGRCGFSGCWDSRRSILHFSYLMTFFSTFCCIFSLISLNKNNTPTQQGCWTYGKSTTSVLYFGISGYYAQVTTGAYTVSSYIDYAEDECDQNSEYCSSCDEAGHTIVFCVFLACATRLSSVMLLKARMNPISDIALIKALGIFSESLAATCLAGACFVWQEYCQKKLPIAGLDYSDGPGIILCAFALTLTMMLVVVHIMIPTIDPSKADEGCCSSKRKEPKKSNKRNVNMSSSGSSARKKHEGHEEHRRPESTDTKKMEMENRQNRYDKSRHNPNHHHSSRKDKRATGYQPANTGGQSRR